MMKRKRKLAILLLLLIAVLVTVLLFIVPLAHTSGETAPTYMNICGILAKSLSRQKNTGLALTLFAMVLGFGGVLIAVLLTPLSRTLGAARSITAMLSGALILVPLVQLLLGRPALTGVLGLAEGTDPPAMGCYILAGLALALIVSAIFELVTGLPKRAAAGKRNGEGAAKGAEQRRNNAARATKKRGAEDEITVLHTATGPVCGRIEGIAGSYIGGVIELGANEEILFGRSPRSANVVIGKNNADISRKHCSVRMDANTGRYLVTDYSRNGTFARTSGNAEEMRLTQKKPTYLSKGTILRLGKRDNEFRLE